MAKDPKKLVFNDKDDLVELLSLIIELSEKHFYRYEIYYKHLSDEINKYFPGIKLEDKIDERYITYLEEYYKKIDISKTMDYIEYKSIEDKIINVQSYLLNLFGDRTTKGGVSFFRFRSEYEKMKKNISLPSLDELPQDFREICNDMYTTRNYMHHMTDAKFIEWKAYRKEQLKTGRFKKWPDRVINIDICKNVSILFLYQLYKGQTEFYYYSKKILKQMRKDYSKIFGETMAINRRQQASVDLSSVDISINGVKRHKGILK